MSGASGDANQIRGKMLSYSGRRATGSEGSSGRNRSGGEMLSSGRAPLYQQQGRSVRGSLKSLQVGQNLEISGQSKPVAGSRGILAGSRQDIYGANNRVHDDSSREHSKASSFLPRQDLEPLSEDIPPDGILFARYRGRPDSLVVFRLHDERARNPERLNLDRRQLDCCPHLEQEQRLRLLNFQNNNIRLIQNLENLPNLIFLDLYNNKLTSLEGALPSVRGLRVLMVGKNRITEISNLSTLRKLDVLDLHSNDIKEIQGMEGLVDLRVLNLAGNAISIVQNLSSLSSLTELNLRRNTIEQVLELDRIPSLQRVFLSHNRIARERNIICLYSLKGLIELSLDANPIAESNPVEYRQMIIGRIPSLKHLDLRRVLDEERTMSLALIKEWDLQEKTLASPERRDSVESNQRPGVLNHSSPARTENTLMGTQHSPEGEMSSARRQSKSSSALVLETVSAAPTTENTPNGTARVSSALDAQGGVLEGHGKGSSEGRGGNLEFGEMQSSKSAPCIQNAFELEVIGSNEKALLVTGEGWEWAHSKRMLSSVTEVSLRHMRKEAVISKFVVNLSWLPSLRTLTLAENDLRTFYDISTLFSSIASHGGCGIKKLNITDNPVCQMSAFILRNYILALPTMPNIEEFNEVLVRSSEREQAKKIFQALVFASNRKSKNYQAVVDNAASALCVGSLENSATGYHEIAKSFSRTSDNISSVKEDKKSSFPLVSGGENRKRSVPIMASMSNESVNESTPCRRRDVEYRFPYRSATGNTTFTHSTTASLPFNISDTIHAVIKRRSAEKRFKELYSKAVEDCIFDTIHNLYQATPEKTDTSGKKTHCRNKTMNLTPRQETWVDGK
eukprot:CAMPEP_0185034562 /NCGR_PEP_ID=MMETSP1103-20130426/24561_1 /TAXON_ID=36769 /ORGANISM="Paraphysomonas bandaiensis, Strain Caron Lab Isolate" /LENGTH=848 /DNA_ID=CAMNT_0027571271 /DNA_START=69 /DNA_END=2615 /DNA_ORIENTATION=-